MTDARSTEVGKRFARPCIAAAVCALLAISAASPAFAAKSSSDDDEALPDARLTGYDTPVNIGGGSAASYALVAVLGVISVGMTFKNARRSHLD